MCTALFLFKIQRIVLIKIFPQKNNSVLWTDQSSEAEVNHKCLIVSRFKMYIYHMFSQQMHDVPSDFMLQLHCTFYSVIHRLPWGRRLFVGSCDLRVWFGLKWGGLLDPVPGYIWNGGRMQELPDSDKNAIQPTLRLHSGFWSLSLPTQPQGSDANYP